MANKELKILYKKVYVLHYFFSCLVILVTHFCIFKASVLSLLSSPLPFKISTFIIIEHSRKNYAIYIACIC